MSGASPIEFPPDGDLDGHFPGDEHERVQKTTAALNRDQTRLWTYVGIARKARLVKPPAKDTTTSRLTDLEYRALTALVMYGNNNLSNSFPGLPMLAKSEHWSLRTLTRAVESLVEKGWVTREKRSSLGTAVNRFHVPAGILAQWHDGWNCPRLKIEK